MGLYLCVFDKDDGEVEGVDVGAYSDFGAFRGAVGQLGGGQPGGRFPVLMNHSDCDGSWSPQDAAALRVELTVIREELSNLAPQPFSSSWQLQVSVAIGLTPRNLAECFIDVDGENLLQRLMELCDIAVARQLPISFQ